MSWYDDSLRKLDYAVRKLEAIETSLKKGSSFDPDFELEINEILNSIRSPMDYSCNYIAITFGKKRKGKFPRCYKPSKFNSTYDNDIGVNDTILKALIESYQPYKCTWTKELGELNNTDKHSQIIRQEYNHSYILSGKIGRNITFQNTKMTNCSFYDVEKEEYINLDEVESVTKENEIKSYVFTTTGKDVFPTIKMFHEEVLFFIEKINENAERMSEEAIS